MITKEQALVANEFHYNGCTHKVGPRGGVTIRIMNYRRSGKTKTWVTRPNDFRVPVKHGLRNSAYITESNASLLHLPEDCPIRQQ